MKMMHRAVARADRQPVGGGDRRGDVALGAAHRLGRASGPWRAPPRSPTTACSRCRGCCAWRCAARRAASTPFGVDQQVDALGAAAVAALDQHRLGAEREQRSRLVAHLGLVVGDRRVEQRRGLRQVGRQHQRARESAGGEALSTASGVEQPVAGGRDHHRIEHDVASACGGRARPPPPRSRRLATACRSSPRRPRDRRTPRRSAPR